MRICIGPRERDTFQVKATSTPETGRRSRAGVVAQDSVEVGGVGDGRSAGVVLPRLLADRLGLTHRLG